jgi:hypothetical protein
VARAGSLAVQDCHVLRLVSAQTLDEFAETEGIADIRLLKLDLEGAETDALLGAKRLLADKAVDQILFEADPVRLKAFGRSEAEIPTLLADNGYRAVCTISSERILRIGENASEPGVSRGDHLFVREELVADSLSRVFPLLAGGMR